MKWPLRKALRVADVAATSVAVLAAPVAASADRAELSAVRVDVGKAGAMANAMANNQVRQLPALAVAPALVAVQALATHLAALISRADEMASRAVAKDGATDSAK